MCYHYLFSCVITSWYHVLSLKSVMWCHYRVSLVITSWNHVLSWLGISYYHYLVSCVITTGCDMLSPLGVNYYQSFHFIICFNDQGRDIIGSNRDDYSFCLLFLSNQICRWDPRSLSFIKILDQDIQDIQDIQDEGMARISGIKQLRSQKVKFKVS